MSRVALPARRRYYWIVCLAAVALGSLLIAGCGDEPPQPTTEEELEGDPIITRC